MGLRFWRLIHTSHDVASARSRPGCGERVPQQPGRHRDAAFDEVCRLREIVGVPDDEAAAGRGRVPGGCRPPAREDRGQVVTWM
jgi:hypothetical protein